MLKHLFASSCILVLMGCASTPKDSAPAESASSESQPAAAVSDPLPLSQNLDEIKRSISGLEIETFGDEKAKQLGLFGELKICRTQLASKPLGGTGELLWDEPNQKLSEEWLKRTDVELKTYQAVFMVAQYRRDYFKRELDQCVKTRSEKGQGEGLNASGVQVTEGDSDNDERVHSFVCSFVSPKASLREFLIQSFSRGTLKLEDFDLEQKFLVANLKDQSGKEKSHGLMFMGWKLSFDQGPLTLKEILLDRRDALLQAWTFSGALEGLENSKKCLKKGAQVWNN